MIAKNISEGQGFISYVYRCQIIFADSTDDSDSYMTILKVPTFKILEEAHEELTPEYQEGLRDIHNIECEFYNQFAKIVDIPLPKVFKTVDWVQGREDGGIHMEDLTRRGKCITHFEGVNLAQVKAVIRYLARMHKNILSEDTLDWKGKYLKNATLFGDFVQSSDQFVDGFLEQCKRKGMTLKFSENRSSLSHPFPFVYNKDFRKLKEINRIMKFGNQKTMIQAFKFWIDFLIFFKFPLLKLLIQIRFFASSFGSMIREKTTLFAF